MHFDHVYLHDITTKEDLLTENTSVSSSSEVDAVLVAAHCGTIVENLLAHIASVLPATWAWPRALHLWVLQRRENMSLLVVYRKCVNQDTSAQYMQQ